MNAYQPLPSPQPKNNTRKKRAYDSHSKAKRILAAELSLKLTINSIIVLATLLSLYKLLPYYLSQQSKLKEVRNEIKDTQKRVDQLTEEFTYYFDSKQSQMLIKKYSPKIDEREIVIFWREGE